ncbi:hypothetical protein [Pseudarthrobacter sp. PS3-L1]|uniref:hypothetical protein n=1 Tax=Pseudarthrobacter sp. PS3-L1 TaxID=3046207 RepID=UPI0024BA1581|nr:hypothetical protein [Pseudarthrobacter sp. PS3-L1]MDJ0320013.1 hypothetical protein [Pseudarthrobacter sp. PS3-L1]
MIGSIAFVDVNGPYGGTIPDARQTHGPGLCACPTAGQEVLLTRIGWEQRERRTRGKATS